MTAAQEVDAGAEILRRFRVGQRGLDLPREQTVLLGVAREQVGRQAEIALAGELLREVERVLRQAVALVEQDHRGMLARAGGLGEEGLEPITIADTAGHHFRVGWPGSHGISSHPHSVSRRLEGSPRG
jgi:hypothetical protein